VTINIPNLQALPSTAQIIINALGNKRVITLSGNLGAGKTTLVKALAQHLGTTETVSSPTYSLVNEYHYGNNIIYHLDLYRLETLDEALAIGIEDYLYSGNYCFVEWANIIAPLLPNNTAHITITANPNQTRTLILNN
jgi:tRNA threonylcarbamoyladenosine biosynthesis protein TsaE